MSKYGKLMFKARCHVQEGTVFIGQCPIDKITLTSVCTYRRSGLAGKMRDIHVKAHGEWNPALPTELPEYLEACAMLHMLELNIDGVYEQSFQILDNPPSPEG